MINRRFVASGCSCTQYCWPTWADYLGRHFQDYINVGLAGADNAVIARNVIESAQPGDLVVIAWTGFDRFNRFDSSRIQETKTPGDQLVVKWSGIDDVNRGGWHHSGGFGGDKKFLLDHYHRVERFRHSLDYVKMVEMHSKIIGYDVYNFAMINWFTGECESKIDPQLQAMHNNTKLNHFYLVPTLDDIRSKIAPITVKHKYNLYGDTHPTPLVNWIWLKDHMAPEIGVAVDKIMENQVKLDQERVLKGDVD